MKYCIISFTFFFLLLQPGLLLTHNCIHDEITKNFTPQVSSSNITAEEKKRILELSNWETPRIIPDYSNLESLNEVDPEKYGFIKNDLVPALVSYFENLIKIIPSHKLYMPAYNCYDAAVPEDHIVNGIDGDIIVYILWEANAMSGTIASATSCFLDGDRFNRPYAGRISFNIFTISTDSQLWDSVLSVSIHEFTHLLGLSDSLFDFFVDSNGELLGKSKVIKDATIRDVPTSIIVLEPVVKVAREHFGCDTLEGVEIENQGALSSRGSHWERRVLGNEYMTSSISENMVVSKFTLAFLEGSGWYQVDYSKAESFTFGKNLGCDFIEKSCFKNKSPQFSVFCDPLDQYTNSSGCSYDNIFKSYCPFSTAKVDPYMYPEMDYFDGGLYGIDFFADNCFYKTPFINGDCRLSINKLETYAGESYSGKSRCYEGTIIETSLYDQYVDSYGKSYIDSNYDVLFYSGLCYETSCSQYNGSYIVVVTVGDRRVTCVNKGEKMEVTGYEGHIYCPDPVAICENLNLVCPNACSGNGNCNEDGTCSCYAGYVEEDCSLQYCLNDCSSGENGICLSDSGICDCYDGWGGEDCSEKILEINCENCGYFADCYGNECICFDYLGKRECDFSLNYIPPSYTTSALLILLAIWSFF